uniref:Flotillin-like n=1 Tax=Leersia perrieri TaxID=77586 RepID=A0A0D9VHK7_9ORYZ
MGGTRAIVHLDISLMNYTFEVQAISAEKLPFILPAVFTIGCRADDPNCLLRYAKIISPHNKLSHHVNELIKDVIKGESRVLAASMTMEEIFQGTKSFRQSIFENVQLELNQFGLIIYNANVKQLVDVEAANQVKVDGAEARMKGEGEGAKEKARVKAEVKVFENEREAEVAEANAGLRQTMVAEVEAAKASPFVEVERTNAARQTEKLKAEQLSKAVVDYEMKVQQANWELYNWQKAAEALLYEQEKAAEAMHMLGDALRGSYPRAAATPFSM